MTARDDTRTPPASHTATPQAKPGARVRAEAVINAAFIFALLIAWLIQTNIGLADNGDYSRTMTWVTSGPVGFAVNNPDHADPEWERRYFFNWIPEWKLDYPGTPRFLSSAWLLWWPGVLFNHLFISNEILYLQTFSILPKLILGTLFVCLLLWIERQKKRGLYLTTALPVLLILTDTNYIAPLNSFFFESAQFVFLFLFLAALLHHWHKPSWVSLALGLVALLLLASSKASSIYWPLLGVPFLLKDRIHTSPKVFIPISILLAIGFCSIAFGIVKQPPMNTQANQYNSLFAGVLTFSKAPEQRLVELGIANSGECVGFSTFDPEGSVCFARVKHQMTFTNTLNVMLQEPLVIWRMFLYTAEQLQPTFVGPAVYSETETLRPRVTVWPVYKYVFSIQGLLLVPALIASSVLLLHWRKHTNETVRAMSWQGLLLLIAVSIDMFIQIIGDGRQEILKHLYLSRLMLDLGLVAGLTACLLAGAVERRWSAIPRWPVVTILAVVFIFASFLARVDYMRRADFAEMLVGAYTQVTDRIAPTASIEIADIEELPLDEQKAIRQLYGLKITRGTFNDGMTSKFTPDETTHPPQAIAFIQRWISAIWIALRA